LGGNTPVIIAQTELSFDDSSCGLARLAEAGFEAVPFRSSGAHQSGAT